MFKAFIITLWIQYEGALYVKYALPFQSECNVFTWWSVQEQFEKSPMDIVAMKCTPLHKFKLDKRIYNNELN